LRLAFCFVLSKDLWIHHAVILWLLIFWGGKTVVLQTVFFGFIIICDLPSIAAATAGL
jgi:hypothetical protein